MRETDIQRLERIRQTATPVLFDAGQVRRGMDDLAWLLAQAKRAQELRAALEGIWSRIHAFNKEWYNGGFCVLCAEDMLAHSPDCALDAARRALEVKP